MMSASSLAYMANQMKSTDIIFKVLTISLYGFFCKNKISFKIEKLHFKKLMPRICLITDAEYNSLHNA